MKDKVLRRLAVAFAVIGALPMYLMLALLTAYEAEIEFRVLSVLLEVIYVLAVPAVIAALTVIQKRDSRSAALSVIFFAAVTLAEAALMTPLTILMDKW